jgi:hypothetical protein
VQLGLTSDGFNLFGNMRTTYSIWPVVLMLYNLPSWMIMKDHFMILSLIILGCIATENDIDVYLQSLVDDLHELWNKDVATYIFSTKETFQLHVVLLWTINDFFAYENLFGYSMKGKQVSNM